MTDNLTFRPMTRDELDLCLDWAAAEGWNPGLHDAEAFWAADPDGFVVAEQDGEIIGTGAIVKYSPRLGAMGLFIMRPDKRGQGLGRQLWYHRRDLLLSRMDDDATIMMDGVVAMQPFYAEGGFGLEHQSTRRAGVVQGGVEPSDQIVPLHEVMFEDVVAFDAEHFGTERRLFLAHWIDPADGTGLALVDESGEIAGMGVIRLCRNGSYKIGPLFARTADAAEELFLQLAKHADGKELCLDTPDTNQAALNLAEKYGLHSQFTCGRMYFGPNPWLPTEQIYGVTTFELG
ncbi:GNAT family N-acetyltransferase [Calycomorphotria hydatis]|uniref:Acetyltransferase (GNAT) family protein n=1 Tax=Calycomorphotria hydatis TaxID=2528027 RepID=A0A517TB08_9PLAN|nr:GNAT family N-acetyltransferase [Calycomorphotria hydatis]QDT65557.1 Acetyltransferase (GNAT) family protein [Calycomorphotria hydatis]